MNFLKPYYARGSQVASDGEEQKEPVKLVAVASSVFSSVQEDDGVTLPDESLLHGRLRNSETRKSLFGHLSEGKRAELSVLMNNYLFV